MNKDNVMFHLREAKEGLENLVYDVESDEEYHESDLAQAMAQIYFHLNTAWNSRNASQKDIDEGSEDNFRLWKRFPDDDELSFGDE